VVGGFDRVSHCVAQADLQLLGSSDPPNLASKVVVVLVVV
jgi:hypothetical protein